ncbi:fimbrial protein [Paraburkholderia sp. IMGN_8]|uniref:fimbrial protein n=1 Tax=Paraburkholderia sp. IMGN_8 TaxID=3136564 RepID=UPI003100C2E2
MIKETILKLGRSSIRRLLPWVALSLLGTGTAHATLNCSVGSGESVVLLDMTQKILVPEDAPIGTVLMSAYGVSRTANCLLNITYPLTSQYAYVRRPDLTTSTRIGNGLAIYVTYNGDRGNTAADWKTDVLVDSVTKSVSVPFTVDIELVKIGATPTSSDSKLPSNYVHVLSVADPSQNLLVQSGNAMYFIRGLQDFVVFTKSTCSVVGDTNPVVNLGTFAANGKSGLGSGIGSTSPSRDFTLELDCKQGSTGAFSVALTLDGQTVSGYESAGVLALSSQTGAATGVGVQVLKGDSGSQTSVQFGSAWDVTSRWQSDGHIELPFSARYYQTTGTITPGPANATATYTISYM